MPHAGLQAPHYDRTGLAGVLPGVAASLGVSHYTGSGPSSHESSLTSRSSPGTSTS